ncbi:outer membrane beta-barrel family protein [Brumimicrobium aurantiacum]|uniref:TonB-dependent receptor n=1 Tax=Brumimicrobium aurantiacum TaxID=1737063 RepID=A0A3E1F051_9FLAO|nr:outer membrane beta-barrel family protein [Brumimicrobium aurantiacum]RFC55103.1 TonB-dependent receptor [Brumimicrobium aurantiacum]
MQYYFCLIFVLVSTLGFTQSKLSLKVVDDNEAPIEYANFRLFSPIDSSVVKGEYSSLEGKIVLENVPAGNYYAVISFFGFKNHQIDQFEIIKNKNLNLGTIKLTKIKSQDLEEVEIRGETSLMESSIDKRTYNVSEDMTAVGGGLTEVLNNIPSVEVDNDGNVSLRGNGSVTILIDGRQSVLSSGDGALDGIPASAIERIELVTNPSAKYNPEGTAGIINIVLKKKKLRGINTNVQLTAASENLYSANVGFNIRNEKINFYASYSYRYREGFRNNFNERTSNLGSSTEFLTQDRLGTDFRESHTGKIGADFFLADNQVFGISVAGTDTDRIREGRQDNELFYDDALYQTWDRQVYDPRTRKSLDINANYKLDFKDEKGDLIIAASQSLGDELSIGEFKENYYNPDGTPTSNSYRFQNQERTEDKSNFIVSTDLVREINKNMKYEAGLQTRISRQNEGNYLEYYDTITETVLPDPNVNNELAFDEEIYSAYGIFGHQLTDKFKYQAGVRLEQAFVEPRLLTTNESFENNYFSFFPSIHASYGNDEKGEIFGSYSRRINRPGSREVNPFPVYSDPLNLRVGNPAIRPEYINSYELGYEKIWKSASLTSTLYFKQTVDRIQRIRQFYDDGVSITSFANVDESYDYGVELIGTYSPFKWWKNMVSINAYESRLSAEINGTTLSNQGVSWDAKLNSTFSFFDNTTAIQLNAQYIAPRYTVQGIYQRNPGIDIGFTRTLMDKKMVLGVRVTDVFNQKGFYFEINDGTVIQETEYKWTTRRLYLTLSYKFGNLTTKNKELRDKIKDAEIEE